MADDENPVLPAVGVQELGHVIAAERARDRALGRRLDVQRPAGQLRGLERAQLRARVAGRELQRELGQRDARGLGLAPSAWRELALLIGLGVVRNGLAVP